MSLDGYDKLLHYKAERCLRRTVSAERPKGRRNTGIGRAVLHHFRGLSVCGGSDGRQSAHKQHHHGRKVVDRVGEQAPAEAQIDTQVGEHGAGEE